MSVYKKGGMDDVGQINTVPNIRNLSVDEKLIGHELKEEFCFVL